MTKDWLHWHNDYATPGSSLSRRLLVVQAYLERALTEAPTDADGNRCLISMCAGDGRDVLPVLAGRSPTSPLRASGLDQPEAPTGERHGQEPGGVGADSSGVRFGERRGSGSEHLPWSSIREGEHRPGAVREATRALLVELNPELAQRARAAAADLGLTDIEVRTGDAGLADAYLDAAPAHIVLACGVFGNISPDDVTRTIAALPALMSSNATLIWTRGRGTTDTDPSEAVRAHLAEHGFHELTYTNPPDAPFRVGMHRLAVTPTVVPPLAGQRLFAFT